MRQPAVALDPVDWRYLAEGKLHIVVAFEVRGRRKILPVCLVRSTKWRIDRWIDVEPQPSSDEPTNGSRALMMVVKPRARAFNTTSFGF